jgi:hypothetical protein
VIIKVFNSGRQFELRESVRVLGGDGYDHPGTGIDLAELGHGVRDQTWETGKGISPERERA